MCSSTQVANKMVYSFLLGNCTLYIQLCGLGPQKEMGSVGGCEYQHPTLSSKIMYVKVICELQSPPQIVVDVTIVSDSTIEGSVCP